LLIVNEVLLIEYAVYTYKLEDWVCLYVMRQFSMLMYIHVLMFLVQYPEGSSMAFSFSQLYLPWSDIQALSDIK